MTRLGSWGPRVRSPVGRVLWYGVARNPSHAGTGGRSWTDKTCESGSFQQWFHGSAAGVSSGLTNRTLVCRKPTFSFFLLSLSIVLPCLYLPLPVKRKVGNPVSGPQCYQRLQGAV